MEQGMLVIEASSEAGQALAEAMADPSTRKVSLWVREDGLAIKVNDYGWSVGMETTAKR